MNKAPLSLIIATLVSSTWVIAEESASADDGVERISILGNRQDLQSTAGSVSLIDELELEKFEYDDIGRVLASVPGVNIRQEDGYGLRPNIGFRGVTPERSRKINIMEDGVLIGPAPYSAPAAYYFPLTAKMTAVEVTKGPSTIKYGPNTVAGALNLVTRQVPDAFEGGVDLALGSDGYQKAHAYVGGQSGAVGYVLDAITLQADGFKDLDGGGDTGFDKNDLMAKFNLNLDGDGYEQLVELKLAYADETSDETYLGLSDADFASTPYRRYAASQLDQMEWEHTQLQLTHHIEFDTFNVTTRIYRHDFERAWFKVDRFGSSLGGDLPSIQAILTHPDSELHQAFYQVLTGELDNNLQQLLVLTNNDREYYSQGIQIDGAMTATWFGLEHQIEAGIRFHEDEIQRNHTAENFNMRSATLVATGEGPQAATTNTEQAEAISVYLQDTVAFDALSVTVGVRGELIDGFYQNRVSGREQDFQNKTQRIWLPSISGYYAMSERSGMFAGIHQGFVPTSPLQAPEVKIEKSVNYELGWRYSDQDLKADLVAFFNDYSNLKESCSVSAGCEDDQEFNAGEVDVYGLEVSVRDYVAINRDLAIPWSVVYTHTQSEFKTSFFSAFEQWGFVESGDAVPYVAENVLNVNLGLSGDRWQFNVAVYYSDEMPEAAQTAAVNDPDSVTLAGVETDAYTNIDLSGSYDIDGSSEVYFKVDNLLDDADIVSRRPFGARPTKPRQVIAGYKYRF